MKKKDRIKSSLLAIFPTLESITEFASDDDNYKALRSLIVFAYENKIIPSEEKESLFDFIRSNAVSGSDGILPEQLNFEQFFDQKDKFLELSLSLRALTDRINSLLDTNKIRLPKVTNSMLSRLKREPADTIHKKNVLRSIAFWIGYYRSHLIAQWNFSSLLLICSGSKQHLEHKSGVRIGFALSGRGDVIDIEIIDWLKKNLRDYIDSSLGHFCFGSFGKVRSQDITTLSIDFPKKSPLNIPATYRQSLRGAISLAHQIAIRWAITRYCSQNRFLAIGIAAGEFASLDNYLLSILHARIASDPIIRLTDFARQCILINDIRAVLCHKPMEVTLFNGENLDIWWVMGVWSPFYLDFVPELVQDPILGKSGESARKLFNHLWGDFPEGPESAMEMKTNAIATFLRFPRNSLLGLEIAKTLFYRSRFWEAIQILRLLLSLDNKHIHGRTLLMMNFRSLALMAPNPSIAEELFGQAQKQADYILKKCDYESEDFYCEYAVFYLGKALLMLRNLRNQTIKPHDEKELSAVKNEILTLLSKAGDLFETGLMVSPTGVRAHYLLNSIIVTMQALKNDESIFTDPARPIDGPSAFIRKLIMDHQWQYGFFREDIPQNKPFESMERIFSVFIQSHEDSISLEAYRPTAYFCAAVTWWDLFPVRTVNIARRTIQLLRGAAELAGVMDAKNLCIYSFTRIYGEMLPAGEFISHMNRSIEMVENYSGGDLDQRNPSEILEHSDPERRYLLMTYNF